MALSRTSLTNLQPWLTPYARWLVSLAPYAGATQVRVTSVWRSRAQQQQLYSRYRAGQASFPAAPPGRSKHQYGRAWDMVTVPSSALPILGAWWRAVGGTWHPSDKIHFEV